MFKGRQEVQRLGDGLSTGGLAEREDHWLLKKLGEVVRR